MSTSEEFTFACGHVLGFGKYRGQTVAEVGNEDEGLRYLDWAVDGAKSAPFDDLVAIRTYLKHPDVSRRLDAILEDR